jgi:hypothetical protein
MSATDAAMMTAERIVGDGRTMARGMPELSQFEESGQDR